jgi:hypothetical protein
VAVLDIPFVDSRSPRGRRIDVLSIGATRGTGWIETTQGRFDLPDELHGWAALSAGMGLDGPVEFGRFRGAGRPHGGYYAEFIVEG